FNDMFTTELEICRNGSTSQRRGIAQVASEFAHDPKYSERCHELLIPLLNDPEKEVRQELWKLYRRDSFQQHAVDGAFISAYIKSKAFSDHPSQIIYSLEEVSGSLIPFGEIVFSICEVFSTSLQEKSRDHSSDTPHTVSKICSLVLR